MSSFLMRLHPKKYIFYILAFVSLSNPGISQTQYGKMTIASPNAASLGKFVDIPVSYHTGLPQINVPIYTIKEGTLQLPISLSYHPGGVKVADPASWVGAGWALNAGGVITRTVRGIPDEAANTVTGQFGHFNNYGFSSYLVEDQEYINGQLQVIKNGDLMNRSADGEPDLFFFNFNGHTGKFYFSDDRTPVLVSAEEDLKIDYYYRLPASAGSFLQTNIQGFCITTGDGTKYYFGKTQAEEPAQGVYPVEISIPLTVTNGLSSDRVISSWYLNKIESPDKVSFINFVYEAESYSNYLWSFFSVPLSSATELDSRGYQLYKMYNNGVRLSKILFSDNTLTFTPDVNPRLDLSNSMSTNNGFGETANTEAKALKQIAISNASTTYKTFVLHYSYFEDNTSTLPQAPPTAGILTTDTKRLKLDSIAETGSDGTSIKPYRFNYYSNFLPRRLSFAIDHWGFYNAALNNSVIPTYSVDTYDIHTGANRDAAWPAMLNGALTKITYPTGGYAEFEFESNRAKVDAVNYNLVYDKQIWVGFDGSYSKEWQNQVFTGNEKYQLIFANTACGSSVASCGASYTILRADGSVLGSGSASAGQSQKTTLTIPAGTYKIMMYRDGATSGTGANLTFSKYVPYAVLDPTVGGLRVKSITKNALDPSSSSMTETFSYEENGRSTGILYGRPYYVYMLRSDLVAQIGLNTSTTIINPSNLPSNYFVPIPYGCLPSVASNGGYYENKIKSPGSILPMANVQGNHIGYRSVRVDQGTNGYSIYRYYGSNAYENNTDDVAYRNLNTTCDLKTPSFPFLPRRYEFQRGELMSEDHFESNGSLRKNILYSFAYDSTSVYTPAIIYESLAGFSSLAEYEIRGYKKRYNTSYETIIDKQTLVASHKTDTTYFTSLYHRSPTRKVSDLSNGGNIVTNYKYPLDFRVPDVEAISDGWSSYISGCTTCQTEYNNRVANTSATYTDRAIYYHRYRACLARARKQYMLYRRSNFADPGNTASTVHSNIKNGADNELKPILEMHDQFINPPIEVTVFKNKQLTDASYNKYALEAGAPIVYLAEERKVNNYIPLSSNYTASSNNNFTVSIDPRYRTEFSYKSLQGKLVEEQKLAGQKVSYIWGYNNRYPVAEVKNAPSNEVYSQNFENDPAFDAVLAKSSSRVHTGSYSGFIPNPGATEAVSLSTNALTINAGVARMFTYSGWVFSEGASTELYLFMYRAGETGYYTYVDAVGSGEIGKWVYLKKSFLVPADVVNLKIRVDNNGGSNVWFDDLRIHPTNSLMSTYTYDPLSGLTSQIDAKGQATLFEYDTFQRLRTVRDQNSNIIKTNSYHYKN